MPATRDERRERREGRGAVAVDLAVL